MRIFRLGVLAASTCVIFVAATSAHGGLIQPTSAVASSESNAGFDARAIHTIDGTGLPVGFGPSDSHAAYASGNHWTTAAGTSPTTAFITWGFAAPEVLDTIYIWNHRSNAPPANNPGYDVTVFDLTLLDSSSNVLLVLNDVALAPDTATGQTFSFGGAIAGVSSVRFDVEAVQSSTNFTGLAEVAFNRVTAVPEPSTVAMVSIGVGLFGLASLGRRRRAGQAV
jgi:hypothetical protein